MSNITPAALADEIGQLDADHKALGEALDAKKDALKMMLARNGETIARGERFMCSVTETVSDRLDTKRLKADLGGALDGYYVKATSLRMTIKAAPRQYEVA